MYILLQLPSSNINHCSLLWLAMSIALFETNVRVTVVLFKGMWLGIHLQVKWCHTSKRIQPCELGGIHKASSAAYPEVPPMLPWPLWTVTGVPRNLKVLLPLKGMVWPHSESWGSYALPEGAWTARLQHLGTLGLISDSKYQQVCNSCMYNAYGTYTGLCTNVELNVLYYMCHWQCNHIIISSHH